MPPGVPGATVEPCRRPSFSSSMRGTSTSASRSPSTRSTRRSGGCRRVGSAMASLVVVCGKGGVGKTTVAVDIAARAVREGRRAILAEVAAKRDAGPLLEGTGVRHVSIAPDDALEEYLHVHLPLRPLAALLPR